MKKISLKDLQAIIALAIELGIIKFSFKKPITFKSGIKSPTYGNWRESTYNRKLRRMIRDALLEMITGMENPPEVIAGVATGGMPMGMLLAEALQIPFVWIRPDAQAKGYGLGNVIEGGPVKDLHVLVLEDLVSTAQSLLTNVDILKSAGAKSITAVSMFTYDMEDSRTALEKANVVLHSLVTVADLLPYVEKQLKAEEFTSFKQWIANPRGWFNKYKLTFEFGYLTTLRRVANATGNIACMGLDIKPEALPEKYKAKGILGAVDFLEELFIRMKELNLQPAAFKPNHGFYEKYDKPMEEKFDGSIALKRILALIRKYFPESKIEIFDFKRGDIGPSSANYAVVGFDNWEVDAVTVHGYMGTDSVEPFNNYCNDTRKGGVYILTRTSNPGNKDLQAKKLASGNTVYGETADNIIMWAKGKPGVGSVVGATSIPELLELAKKFAGKDICLLIPGVGKQGGSAAEVMAALREAGYEVELARINNSSALTHPWGEKTAPDNYLEVCLSNIGHFLQDTAIAA